MAEFTRNTTQIFLQKSLAEVVRKLRNSTGQSQEELIEQFVNDTQREANSSVRSVKVMAIQKAMYFHMLGYSAEYANFPTVEVMADSVFLNKRIGYVVACSTFREDAAVLPLTPALLKRDLNSSNQYVVGLALYYIATLCTPELARDLVSDVVHLLQHPSTYIRKKAVLSLYKIFVEFPESLRPIYPKLKEKLEDAAKNKDMESMVRGAVVCVLCELARRNPSNYLGLAVPFYSLLFTIHSNWTLIKIVKVFGYFAQSEPRLSKKLADPLTNLILTSSAKSVQYECILAVANGMNKVPSLTKLAVDKMWLFVEESDPNLKCLGLHAMSRLSSDGPKALIDHQSIILSCLKDTDAMVRCKSLSILQDLVTAKSVVSIINTILETSVRTPPDEEWTNVTIAAIVEMAQLDDYSLITNFEWYFGVLVDLSTIEISAFHHGSLLEREMVTILTRVNSIRQFGVDTLARLLDLSSPILKSHPENSTQWRIIGAIAFACGEYPYYLRDRRKICEDLLSEKIAEFSADIQLACIVAVGKIIAYTAGPCERHVHLYNGEEHLHPLEEVQNTTLEDLRDALLNGRSKATAYTPAIPDRYSFDAILVESVVSSPLDRFRFSLQPCVQEYANLTHYLLTENPDVGRLLYAKELPLVALGAQSAIKIPKNVDLDNPLCDNLTALMALSSSDEDEAEVNTNKQDARESELHLKYRIERHQELEQARRTDVSAFYLHDTEDESIDEMVLYQESTEAATAGKKGDKSNATETSRLSLRITRPRRLGKSSQIINRNLLKPDDYVTVSRTNKKRSSEEDEATRRLREINVTHKLSESERLPETLPYAVLLGADDSIQGKTANSNLKRKVVGHRQELFNMSAATLFEDHLLRVTLYPDKCKIRANEVQLSMLLEVSNLSDSLNLQEAMFGLRVRESVRNDPHEQTCAEGSAVLEPHADKHDSISLFEPTPEAITYAGQNGTNTNHLITIARKINFRDVVRVGFTVRVTEMPESLSKPLSFVLIWKRKAHFRHIFLQMPFKYSFFAKREPTKLTTQVFNNSVLAVRLKEATTVSAFIPCDKATLLTAVPHIQELLGLTPMEIFKDMATLYGTVYVSKTIGHAKHVAVLLCEVQRDQVKGIDVNVRTPIIALAELLIHDIVHIIQKSLD